MLESHGIAFRYREYRKEPLTLVELRALFDKLDQSPGRLLRTRDRANQDLGLTGNEAPELLLQAMAEHPTLLQRPIAIKGDTAVIGRPIEHLLQL